MSDKKQISGWKRFLQSMTKANELGKEEEIMTDHDYDGIKELDNVLPPWWLYGFYITILIGIFYYVQVFTNSEKYSIYTRNTFLRFLTAFNEKNQQQLKEILLLKQTDTDFMVTLVCQYLTHFMHTHTFNYFIIKFYLYKPLFS